MDDSFDKRIEASLEEARPLDLQPQYLVRGSVARATTKYSRSSGAMGQARRGSVAHSSLVDRRRPEVAFHLLEKTLINVSLIRPLLFSLLAGPQQLMGCLP